MGSYPIWNEINSCAYSSNKSYGVNYDGLVKVHIGTSASNSFEFLTHRVTHRDLNNGDREYRFYIDNKCVKRGLLKKGTNKIKKLSVREVNNQVKFF